MTDVNAIHRAGQARTELRETHAAFDAVRAAMVAQLLGSPLTASVEREKLYLGVQALDAVRKALQHVVDGGAIEEAAMAVQKSFGAA